MFKNNLLKKYSFNSKFKFSRSFFFLLFWFSFQPLSFSQNGDFAGNSLCILSLKELQEEPGQVLSTWPFPANPHLCARGSALTVWNTSVWSPGRDEVLGQLLGSWCLTWWYPCLSSNRLYEASESAVTIILFLV